MRLASILFILVALASTARAQNIVDHLYRVTAFKAGNPQVVSVSNYAKVDFPQRIYIPNAFTPNGDGINDTFGIKGEGIEDYRMVVFNRWGEVVFETEDPKNQWDGTFKDREAPSGVYTYELFAKGNLSVPRSGSVTLLR